MTAAEYFMQKGEERGAPRAKAEGHEEGRKVGRAEGHCDVAINALRKGYEVSAVADLTGLDVEVVEQLKAQLEQQLEDDE